MVNVFAAGDAQLSRLMEHMLIGAAVDQQAYADLIRGKGRIVQPLSVGEEPAFHACILLAEGIFTQHSICF